MMVVVGGLDAWVGIVEKGCGRPKKKGCKQ